MPETIDAPMQTQPQGQGEPPVPGEGAPSAEGSPTGDVSPVGTPCRVGDPGPQAPAAARAQVRAVQFAEAPPDAGPAGAGQFDILLDMSVPVSVVLGQTQIPIRRLLQLGPGSVLPLEKPVETPADLYLKNSKFAEVDVVVVEDRFAVRIRKIVSATAATNP